MIYKRHTHSKIIFVSFIMTHMTTLIIFYLLPSALVILLIKKDKFIPPFLVLIALINVFFYVLNEKILKETGDHLVTILYQQFFTASNSFNCSEYAVESSALSYARANYGAGASATGCTFNTGTVRKSGDTYSVTVFCGGNNPIDFTYECSNSGLQLVSVEL